MILLQRFFQVCLFRAGPADVPASPWLFKLAVLVYFIVGGVVSRIDYDWMVSLVASLADTAVMMAGCGLLLSLRGLTARYMQTATALAGTGSIMGILGLPVFWLFREVEPHGQIASLVLLLVLVVIFWSLLITAHIFRHALNIGAGLAAVITVLYTIVSLIVVGIAMSGVV
jgi:hypothetical protein